MRTTNVIFSSLFLNSLIWLPLTQFFCSICWGYNVHLGPLNKDWKAEFRVLSDWFLGPPITAKLTWVRHEGLYFSCPSLPVSHSRYIDVNLEVTFRLIYVDKSCVNMQCDLLNLSHHSLTKGYHSPDDGLPIETSTLFKLFFLPDDHWLYRLG